METIGELLVVVLGSGTVGALASIGVKHLQQRRTRNESTRLLALRVAFVLEGYAIDRAEKLSDDDRAKGTNDAAGQYMEGVPQCSEFPDDPDYALIKSTLLAEILDFSTAVQVGRQSDNNRVRRHRGHGLGTRGICQRNGRNECPCPGSRRANSLRIQPAGKKLSVWKMGHSQIHKE